MTDETHNLQKDPPEGSREVIDRELDRPDDGNVENNRETGARKFEPDNRDTDPEFDQDAAENRPKKPYGLTEPIEDRGPGTRHYDGQNPAPAEDAKGQFAQSKTGKDNSGISSAKPRVISGDEDGDATFETKPEK